MPSMAVFDDPQHEINPNLNCCAMPHTAMLSRTNHPTPIIGLTTFQPPLIPLVKPPAPHQTYTANTQIPPAPHQTGPHPYPETPHQTLPQAAKLVTACEETPSSAGGTIWQMHNYLRQLYPFYDL